MHDLLLKKEKLYFDFKEISSSDFLKSDYFQILLADFLNRITICVVDILLRENFYLL